MFKFWKIAKESKFTLKFNKLQIWAQKDKRKYRGADLLVFYSATLVAKKEKVKFERALGI